MRSKAFPLALLLGLIFLINIVLPSNFAIEPHKGRFEQSKVASHEPLISETSVSGSAKKSHEFVKHSLARVEIPFIENQGQIENKSVRFYASTFGGTAYVTSNGEMVYTFPGNPGGERSIGWALKESLLGSSLKSPEGAETAGTKVNYFIGKDPAKWRTGLPTYKSITLGEVYPGIELALKAQGKNVEKIFTVNPGAEPGVIKIKMDGVSALKLNDKGELEAETGKGPARFTKPIAYQEKNGRRENVQVAYLIYKDTYGFKAHDYDRSLPLVIDPALVYSTYLGGNAGEEYSSDIAVDSNGNAYVIGFTSSYNFPTTTYPYQGIGGGIYGFDAFVAKINSAGSALVYSTYLGGSSEDHGRSIALAESQDGEVFACVAGDTMSLDFPVANEYQGTNANGQDGFVALLNPEGSSLLYSTYLGGSLEDRALAIAAEYSEEESSFSIRSWITGTTTSTDFPTVSPYQGDQWTRDAFVSKFEYSSTSDPALVLVYSTYLGGGGNEYGRGIVVDSEGNAYVTGETDSTDFPTTTDAFQITPNSFNKDAFVTKLSANGSALVYSTFLGGSCDEWVGDIAIDSLGFAYVTGTTWSSDTCSDSWGNHLPFPLSNPYQDTLNVDTGVIDPTVMHDAFVTKLNADGSELVYSTYLGGGKEDRGHGIAVDSFGNAYVSGWTGSTDGTGYIPFPTLDPLQSSYGGNGDAFVTKFNAAGNDLIYSSYLGGSQSEYEGPVRIAIGASGGAYVTGTTRSSDFPTQDPIYYYAGGGTYGYDAYVARIDDVKPTLADVTLNPPGPVKAGNVTFTIFFSEDMDQGVSPSVEFGSPAKSVSGSYASSTTWQGIYEIQTGYDGNQDLIISGAMDLAGNMMEADVGRSFVVDTTPPLDPSIASATPSLGPIRTPSVALMWAEGSDAVSGVAGYSWDVNNSADTLPDDTSDGTVPPSEINFSFGDGSYWIHIRTLDQAGNWTSTYHYGPWVLDTTPPSAPTLNPVTSPTNISTQIISGAKETDTSVWLNGSEIVGLDGGTIWSYAIYLAEGPNSIVLTLKDEAGNESTATTGSIVLDTIPPNAPALNAVISPTNQSPQTISGTKDADTSVWLNSEQVVPVDSSNTWSYLMALTEGVNSMPLTSKDQAGNESGTTSGEILYDSTTPFDPTILYANPDINTPINDKTIELWWNPGYDSGSWVAGYSWAVDNLESTLPDQLLEFAGLPSEILLNNGDVDYWIHVRTVDQAGNWTSTYHYGPWKLDTAGPEAPTFSPSGGTYNVAQDVSSTLAIDAANTYYTLDGSDPESWSNQYGGAIHIDGNDGQSVILKMVSYDAAWNKGEVGTATYTFAKDLVSRYEFNGNADDETTYDNNGFVYGGVTSSKDRLGSDDSAYLFDGSSGYVEVADSESLKIYPTLSISAWVKRNRLDGIDIILEKGGDWNDDDPSYGVGLHNAINNNMFYFFFDGGWRGTDGVNDLKWHHYAVVATHNDANPQLYIDGAAKDVLYSGGATEIVLVSNSLPLHIGAQKGTSDYYSNNTIDDLRIYARALSADEIRNMNPDADGDGIPDQLDNCPLIWNLGQEDLDGDGIGDVCDQDKDGDGYDSTYYAGADCNDENASVNPGAAEVCDGIDNNCDGQTDEGFITIYYRDMDNDGYGNAYDYQVSCTVPTGYVADNTDCNDNDPIQHPGQIWYLDADGDGYSEGTSISSCSRPWGYKADLELIALSGDCNDGDFAVNPGAAEVCDSIDNNCNGSTDEGVLITYYQDSDGDGFGDSAISQTGCSPPTGYVADNTDCDDNDLIEHPGQTWYKDADDDGYSDGTTDTSSCTRPSGYKAASELTATSGDCNDANSAVYPGAPELCDGLDNNCNSTVDEGFPDTDSDGAADCVDGDDDNDGIPDEADIHPLTSDTAYTLTVARSGSGEGSVVALPVGVYCGSDCEGLYASGTLVSLEARQAAGSHFAGWSGGCSGEALTCRVKMDAAKSVVATFNSGTGEQSTWTMTHSRSENDRAASVQQTSDGGYIVLGDSWSNATNYDLWALKLTGTGSAQWQKLYADAGADSAGVIRQTADGGYIVVSSGGSTTSCNAMRLDSSGNIAWQRKFDASYGVFNSAMETSDGGYVLAGTRQTGTYTYSYFVVKLESTGNVSWQKTYAMGEYNWHPMIRETSDRGFILAGASRSMSTSYQYFLARLDSNGNVIWGKAYGYAGGQSEAYDVRETSDKGYILVGRSNSFSVFYNVWVLKLNAAGGIVWQKNYGKADKDSGEARSVLQTADGGYAVLVSGSVYGDAILILKLRGEGTLEWQKLYNAGTVWTRGFSIENTGDGGYIVGGYTSSAATSQNKYLVAKLLSDGSLVGCSPGFVTDANLAVSDTSIIAANATVVTSVQSYTTSVVISASASDTSTIPVVLCPGTTPDISVSPQSYNYGNVYVGSGSSSTFTVSNQGEGSLLIGPPVITDPAEFSVLNNCSALAHGETCTVEVVLNPLSEGAKSATLSIASNDPDNPNVIVSLSAYAIPTDPDGDGIPAGSDNCPDDFNPGQTDMDHDGTGDACDSDADGDGIDKEIDCDDLNPSVGEASVWYRDQDGDGYGDSVVSEVGCAPTGFVTDNTDCNDNDPEEHPDQTWYKDVDNDGYSDGTTDTSSCTRPPGYKTASELTATSGDCNDGSAAVNPGAPEACDGVDNNCNGQSDEGLTTTYYQDADGDGYGNPAVSQAACSAPSGYVTDNTDCNDNDQKEHPGQTWYKDADDDGYSDGTTDMASCNRPVGFKLTGELTATSGDCNDGNAAINPGTLEVCDGVDNNCNGAVDEGSLDTDGDGIADCADTDDDNDSLTDTDEASLGTNPLDPDTDNDGYDDGVEVAAGYDPKSDTSEPPYLADGFAASEIDPANWSNTQFIRRIRNGAIQSVLEGRDEAWLNNHLSFVYPNSVNEIRADVTVDEVHNDGVWLRARLAGNFYRDTDGHDIHVQIGIKHAGGALQGYYAIIKCHDEECGPGSSTTVLWVEPGDWTAALGETKTISLRRNGATTEFTFDFGDKTASANGPAVHSTTPDPQYPFKGIGTRVSHYTDEESTGTIKARFDNIYKNGSLYDDFGDVSGLIDPGRWSTWEYVRAIENGMSESELSRYESNGSNALYLKDPQSVKAFQCDLAVDKFSNNAANPQARLVGAFYNDGTVGEGRSGDILAMVGIGHNGTDIKGFYAVARCLAGDCSSPGTYDLLYYSEDFGAKELGSFHRSSLDWNGSSFTFGMDGNTFSWNPTTLAPPVGPPRIPFNGIGTRVSGIDSASEWGHVRARFDNFVVTAPMTDSDADGMPDTWEQQIVNADPVDAITNVYKVLAGDDFDGDGLTNLQEHGYETNPILVDTDSDGWSDLHEVQASSDPTQPASTPNVTALYVGGIGANDANIGTLAYPLKTVHEAVARVNSRWQGLSSINLAAGIYNLSGEPDSQLYLSENVTMTGAGSGLDGSVVDGSGTANWKNGFIVTPGASSVTISGLKLTGFERGITVRSDGGCINLENSLVQSCAVGISLEEGYQIKLDLSGSEVAQNTTGIRISAGSSNNTILNGSVANNNGDGIVLEGCSETPDSNLINGTIVSGNAGNGALLLDGSGNRIQNAVIQGNNTTQTGYAGVAVFAGCTSINQSLISGNSCYGVYADESLSGSPVNAQNNDWGNPSGPSGAGFGTGDAVSEYVSYAPWIGFVAGADSDRDGWQDQAEVQGGTNPYDPLSYPAIVSFFVGGPGASDDSLGDTAHPMASLHGAIERINSVAVNNYYLTLTPGTYSLAGVEADMSLVVNQNLTILGTGAVLDGAGATTWKDGILVSPGVSRIEVRGLKIRNFQGSGVLVFSGGGCLTFKDAEISSSGTGLRLVGSYNVSIDLDNSKISGCGYGVEVVGGSSNNRITYGEIRENSKDGILVDGCSEMPDENVIQYVKVLQNAQNGIALLGGSRNSILDSLIQGNNISHTGYGGIAVSAPCSVINWNTIAGNSCHGLYAEDFLSGAPVDARYNWWGCDASGPFHLDTNPMGIGDTVGDNVLYSPWLGQESPMGDSDGDGLLDKWEIELFGHLNYDGDDDPDGDGLPNSVEQGLGSDPNNPVWIAITTPASSPYYTNDSTITVTGETVNADSVSLTVNGFSQTVSFDSISGSFSANIVLNPGQNTVTANATRDADSETVTVAILRDSQLALVAIDDPTLGTGETSFEKISMTGQSSDDSLVVSVEWKRTVAGSQTVSGTAVATGPGGTWSSWKISDVPLVKGEVNEIAVTAKDLFDKEGMASVTITAVEGISSKPDEDLSQGQLPPAPDPFDIDGDGFHNDDETKCGSDPEDSDSVPVRIDLGSTYEKRDATDNLIGTYKLPDCINDDDDNDGLPDSWEEIWGATIHVDPKNKDTDGDNVSDAAEDFDSDGLTNLEESVRGTDPSNPDTDGDGALDGAEVFAGMDPLSPTQPGFSIALLDGMDNPINYEQWLPTYEALIKVKATWTGGGTPPASVSFLLRNTSNWPGRAVNDPDPVRFSTAYPDWYWNPAWSDTVKKTTGYFGYDFGLTLDPSAHSFDQGPVAATGSGEYTVYLQCWDFGGRTIVAVVDPSGNYENSMQLPKGAGAPVPNGTKKTENGIASGWEHETTTGLNANADEDRLIFTEAARTSEANPGDNLTNFMEYRGVVYTEGGVVPPKHLRLNPRRNDLFVRHVGYIGSGGELPFAIGTGLNTAGVDVHVVNGWGHDATADGSFYLYYGQGTISSINDFQVTGSATGWKSIWPGNEWELKLDDDLESAWTPVSSWNSETLLLLSFRYLGPRISGSYRIRMPVPPINVLIVHHHPTIISPWGQPDGSISFNDTFKPGPDYPMDFFSSRSWTFKPGPDYPMGFRSWNWSGKGISVPKSSDKFYGLAMTLKIAIDNYFDQMPYKDGTTWTGNSWNETVSPVLEPLSMVEDFEDSGGTGSEALNLKTYDGATYGFWVKEQDGSMSRVDILPANLANENWDGDRRLANKEEWGKRGTDDPSKGNLNPFDIDNDGAVELPPATDPLADNYSKQHDDEGNLYTKERVVQFLITHEIGHALAGAIQHSKVPKCLMYELSINWKRDNFISDQILKTWEVHNYVRMF